MSYFFNEAARVEHLEHVAYYEERRPGLGARYLAAFDAAMVKVCENPERYCVELHPGIRRFEFRAFRTTSFTAYRSRTLRFLSSRLIADVRATGSAGSKLPRIRVAV